MSRYDLQMHVSGVSIPIAPDWVNENLPGQLNLNNEEACDLAYDLEEVRLAILGMAQHEVVMRDLQRGDIFGDFGLTVRSAVTHGDRTVIEFEGHQSMFTRATLTGTVYRKIS